MGSSSSKTVDSVSKEISEIIEKLKDDKKRLDIFIQNRKTRATDQWSEDKESEDKEQMRLTGELVALKTRLTELNKELDGLLQSASASHAAGSGTGSGSNSPAATSFNRPDTQPNSNARNALGPQDPNQPDLTGFEYHSSQGGKIKRKNSKRKNSKRKNSKRKNSKRKNSKRKNSKSK